MADAGDASRVTGHAEDAGHAPHAPHITGDATPHTEHAHIAGDAEHKITNTTHAANTEHHASDTAHNNSNTNNNNSKNNNSNNDSNKNNTPYDHRKKKRKVTTTTPKVVKCTIDVNEIPTDTPVTACPLCGDANTTCYAIQFSKLFLSCPTCQLVFLHPKHHLTVDEEKKRYEEHNNNPYDDRYRQFLAPVVDALVPILGDNHYGCGPGPTLSGMFREKGFKMADYDLFFKPVPFVDQLQVEPTTTTTATHTNSNTTTSTTTTTTESNTNAPNSNPTRIPPYDEDPFKAAEDFFSPPFDFITCTETAEHFKTPARDFKKLLSPLLLKPSTGILTIMTQMLYTKEQFVNWWYLRDKTHVSFYTVATMEYIAKTNNLRLVLPETKNIAIFIRN